MVKFEKAVKEFLSKIKRLIFHKWFYQTFKI